MPTSLLKAEQIASAIHVIRGQRVLLDADLAQLYGVQTKALNQAVRRNSRRFPADFAFQLTREEANHLKYQFGTSSSIAAANLKSQFVTSRWGGRRKLSTVFAEQGVAMLSSVLQSERAILVNVEIMRAFVRLRALLAPHAELARRLDKVEGLVFDAIRLLIHPPEPPARKEIGFRGQRAE